MSLKAGLYLKGNQVPKDNLHSPAGKDKQKNRDSPAFSGKTCHKYVNNVSPVSDRVLWSEYGRVASTLRWGRLRRLGKLACARTFYFTARRERLRNLSMGYRTYVTYVSYVSYVITAALFPLLSGELRNAGLSRTLRDFFGMSLFFRNRG